MLLCLSGGLTPCSLSGLLAFDSTTGDSEDINGAVSYRSACMGNWQSTAPATPPRTSPHLPARRSGAGLGELCAEAPASPAARRARRRLPHRTPGPALLRSSAWLGTRETVRSSRALSTWRQHRSLGRKPHMSDRAICGLTYGVDLLYTERCRTSCPVHEKSPETQSAASGLLLNGGFGPLSYGFPYIDRVPVGEGLISVPLFCQKVRIALTVSLRDLEHRHCLVQRES